MANLVGDLFTILCIDRHNDSLTSLRPSLSFQINRPGSRVLGSVTIWCRCMFFSGFGKNFISCTGNVYPCRFVRFYKNF